MYFSVNGIWNILIKFREHLKFFEKFEIDNGKVSRIAEDRREFCYLNKKLCFAALCTIFILFSLFSIF